MIKIAIAQTIPTKGNIKENTTQHLELIAQAAPAGAAAIFFSRAFANELRTSISQRFSLDGG